MIRQLRERHFRAAILLAVLLPALLIVALVARKPFPTQPIPPALRAQTAP